MQDDGVFNVMTATPAYASILESAVGDEQQNTQSDHYLVEPSKSSVIKNSKTKTLPKPAIKPRLAKKAREEPIPASRIAEKVPLKKKTTP